MTFTILTALTDPEPERALTYLRGVVAQFSRALSLGFLPPAQVQSTGLGPARSAEPLIAIDIHASQLQPTALAILWGMCEWGRVQEGLGITWTGVTQDGRQVPLDTLTAPRIRARSEVPFRLARPDFIGFGEPLVALLEFGRLLNDTQVELLESGLRTWEALMFGGLPPEGNPPGASSVGATSGFFITPTMYQWFVEGVAADSASVDLLVNFFDAQAPRLPVAAIEIES